ncbi:MAG: hypothetical protein HND52_00250 [Ignavibacteriae bacterium]|nr:hypothetical protein [Ignavibacteriota bacterium]
MDGTISFRSTTYEDRDATYATIQFNPQIGLFITDNFSIGLSINYLNNSVHNNETYEWGIGPNSRYYFNLDKIYPFIGVGYLFSLLGLSREDENIKSNQLIFTGGIDVFVTKSVAIETLISYMMKTQTYPKGFISSRE